MQTGALFSSMHNFGLPVQAEVSGEQVPGGWLKAAAWFFGFGYSAIIITAPKISIAAKIKNTIFVGIWNFIFYYQGRLISV